ncbi:hypothetical protein AU488_12290 [Lonsdalea populi]|nr:hypothetical protein AU488_12290 [Lonsdalea populi]
MDGADVAPRFFMPAGHTIAKSDAHGIPFSSTSCRRTRRCQRGIIGGSAARKQGEPIIEKKWRQPASGDAAA